MQAGAEPEGYNLSYSFSLKKFFCFNLRKKRCSEASGHSMIETRRFTNASLAAFDKEQDSLNF